MPQQTSAEIARQHGGRPVTTTPQTYRVTDPRTGRTVRLTGDAPPTEAELNEIFSELGSEQRGGTSGLVPIGGTLPESAILPVGADVSALMGPGTQPRQPLTVTKSEPLTPQTEKADPASRGWLDTASDFAVGVGKGLASTAIGAADLVNRGVAVVGLDERIKPEVFQAAREHFATPTNTAQSLGKGTEQIAEFLMPFGGQARALAAVPRAGRVMRGALRAGGEAAEMGTKAAVQSGGDAEDVVTAALLGSAAPAVAAGVFRMARGLTHTLPERLYQPVFRLAEDDWLKSVQAQARGQAPNPTLAREVLERGLRGSPRNMALFAVRKGDDLEQQLRQHVAGQSVQLPQRQEYARLLDGLAREFGGAFSRIGGEARMLALRMRAGGSTVQATDALAIKRLLDRSRTSASFRMNTRLSGRQDEYKQAADQVRALLHRDPTTGRLLDEERVLIEALDSLTDFAVKSGNRAFTDMVDRLMITGGALLPAMAPAALGTAATLKAGNSAFMLTNLGQAMHRLRWVGSLGGPASTGVMRAGAEAVAAPTTTGSR